MRCDGQRSTLGRALETALGFWVEHAPMATVTDNLRTSSCTFRIPIPNARHIAMQTLIVCVTVVVCTLYLDWSHGRQIDWLRDKLKNQN